MSSTLNRVPLYPQRFLFQRAAELVASDMDLDVATVNRTTVNHSSLSVHDTASSSESGEEIRSSERGVLFSHQDLLQSIFSTPRLVRNWECVP